MRVNTAQQMPNLKLKLKYLWEGDMLSLPPPPTAAAAASDNSLSSWQSAVKKREKEKEGKSEKRKGEKEEVMRNKKINENTKVWYLFLIKKCS